VTSGEDQRNLEKEVVMEEMRGEKEGVVGLTTFHSVNEWVREGECTGTVTD